MMTLWGVLMLNHFLNID